MFDDGGGAGLPPLSSYVDNYLILRQTYNTMTRRAGMPSKRTGFSETAARYEPPPAVLKTTTEIGRDGRIVIPAAMRQAMGAKEGSTLVLLVRGETLEVFTSEAAIRKLQDMVAKAVPEGVSLVDELIADRRREAAEEEND